jgi:hypothetical protein
LPFVGDKATIGILAAVGGRTKAKKVVLWPKEKEKNWKKIYHFVKSSYSCDIPIMHTAII